MQRPKSLFGRPPEKPAYGLGAGAGMPDEAQRADDMRGPEQEDLEHKGMGSLSGIPIHRKKRGAATPAAPSTSAGPAPSEPRNVSDYWSRLRKGRRWPAKSDIDTKFVSIRWRNCLIMVVGERGTPWRFEPLTPGVMRGGGLSLTDNDIDFNHLVMEWILSVGRTAQQSGSPVEDSDVFPTEQGEMRYRVVAAPLGDDDKTVTHILCQIAKA
ncbi:MAG: hypothetical protein JSU82_09195 [Rhodospirillales bacterium]|nr:MAG: hypothetical protein JSU82_09195 [Rhodospirillales bacterium]